MAAAQIDTLQKFGQSFQNKTLNILLHDLGVLNTLNELIHPKFFEAESSKWIVQTTLDYYSLFKKQPTMDVFKVELEKIQSKALKKSVIEQLKIIYVELEKNDTEYIKREFTNFCINQNLKNVIIQSVELLKAGNYDKIKDLVDKATKVGVNSDLGTDYIDDYVARTSETARETVSMPWDVINDLMDGGLGAGELGVIVAPSGVGKCVGADTVIDIQYDEIGFELQNGMIVWYKPWDIIDLGNSGKLTAHDASEIIALSGYGRTN
jgi:hypothetical protein